MTWPVPSWTFISAFILINYGLTNGGAFSKNSRSFFKNGPCLHDQFWCSNDACVSKRQHCNGYDDCGDNSDEEYCYVTACPTKPPLIRCNEVTRTRYRTTGKYFGYLTTRYYTTTPSYDEYFYTTRGYNFQKCIPQSWKCDGFVDCSFGSDESECERDETSLTLQSLLKARHAALNWSLGERDETRPGHKWGSEVARKAVSWYLGDQHSFLQNKTYLGEMADEVSLSLLSRLALKTLKAVSSTELASYVNAFLVTCVDPRGFYDVNLVRELRDRADASNETHPSVTLALCNAGDDITVRDVAKTINVFWSAHRDFRTDVQALAVLALSCAVRQDKGLMETDKMTQLTAELKRKQYRNGTVESLKTTALVLQALYASETEADEDNFDEEKALTQILKYQKKTGSFGSMVNTYYVLPVLAYRSLVNVSASHCMPRPKEEKDRLLDLLNLGGQKSRIRYSLWIGNNRTLERTITLKVSTNTSLYGIMEWAAGIDSQFRFEYIMREKKPYIYSISGIQDDPENNMFWFLHSIGSEAEVTPIKQSPADVVPSNGQHLIFWYKCG